jgi:hypothetical protein
MLTTVVRFMLPPCGLVAPVSRSPTPIRLTAPFRGHFPLPVCIVVRGVRQQPIVGGSAVMQGMGTAPAHEVAARLPRTLDRAGLVAFLALLHEQVRWGGDEDGEKTCHSRDDVARTLGDLVERGDPVTVVGVVVREPYVLLTLQLEDWVRYEVLTVRDGLIVDIRPGDDEDDARRRIGLEAPRDEASS